MLGYSDSARDGRIFASARLDLQRESICWRWPAGRLSIVFFHGRTAVRSAAAARLERAIIAAPANSVEGRLRVTEQGDDPPPKYGIRALALRNLEQMAGAVLRASRAPPRETARDAWRALAAELAGSRARITGRWSTSTDFRLFPRGPPIDVIERLHIGRARRRRPRRHRQPAPSLGVRVVAKTARALTSWYGVGTALRHGIGRRLEAMARMAATGRSSRR